MTNLGKKYNTRVVRVNSLIGLQRYLLGILKKEVAKNDWSVSEACRQMGVSRVYWYKVMDGEHLPSADWLMTALGNLHVQLRFKGN